MKKSVNMTLKPITWFGRTRITKKPIHICRPATASEIKKDLGIVEKKVTSRKPLTTAS